MERKAQGYRGSAHEILGSDILATVRALEDMGGRSGASSRDALATQVLGRMTALHLRSVLADHWYPAELLLNAIETLEPRLGTYGLRQLGRSLFKLARQERMMRFASSGRDAIESMQTVYRHTNRGDHIGAWRVLTFAPNRAELEKTTPHHCAIDEGILSEALAAVGAPCVVSQRECARAGAARCVYVVTPSVSGAAWTGAADSVAPPPFSARSASDRVKY